MAFTADQAARTRLHQITVKPLDADTKGVKGTEPSVSEVSALQRRPYYKGRRCMIFGISGTKRIVRNGEVSVRRGQ